MPRYTRAQEKRFRHKMLIRPIMCVLPIAQVSDYLGVGYDYTVKIKEEIQKIVIDQHGQGGLDYLLLRRDCQKEGRLLEGVNHRYKNGSVGLIDAIKANMKDRELSDKALGDQFGVSYEYVRRLELRVRSLRKRQKKLKKLTPVKPLV